MTIKVIDPDSPAPPANAEELLARVKGMFSAAAEAVEGSAPPVRSLWCAVCGGERQHQRAAGGSGVEWWACGECGLRRTEP